MFKQDLFQKYMGGIPLDSINFIQAHQDLKRNSQKTQNTMQFLSYIKISISEITATKNFKYFPRTRKKRSTLSGKFIVLKVRLNAMKQENKAKTLRLKKETKLKLFAGDI